MHRKPLAPSDCNPMRAGKAQPEPSFCLLEPTARTGPLNRGTTFKAAKPTPLLPVIHVGLFRPCSKPPMSKREWLEACEQVGDSQATE